MLDLDSIGTLLRETREKTGVNIDEASLDLNIKSEFLLNIENGNIGCFKDILELKNYLISYAKYLGLDSEKLIDSFNEYMFEYTSKIPIKEIEKLAEKERKEETNKVVSPYTKKKHKYSSKCYYFVYILIFILVVLAILWSIKQITIDNTSASVISYANF